MGGITHAEYFYKKNIFQMLVAESSREADKPTSADNDFYGCPAIFEFSCNYKIYIHTIIKFIYLLLYYQYLPLLVPILLLKILKKNSV